MNAIIKYIVKHATKNETSSKKYLEIIENLCKNDKKKIPAKKAHCNMLISTISERDYSAQEIAHLLIGWPLFIASQKFVTLPLYSDKGHLYR